MKAAPKTLFPAAVKTLFPAAVKTLFFAACIGLMIAGLYLSTPAGRHTNPIEQIIQAEEDAFFDYLDAKIEADEPTTYHPED